MTDWLPATTQDLVECVNCGNQVDTPEEVATYPSGNCPDCGNSWTGSEKRSTIIQVTAPQALGGGAG
jgi:predicted RNA-binding Zn-ribbon protein involved in translation (DUF1610 family)